MKRRVSTGEVSAMSMGRFFRLQPHEMVPPHEACPFFKTSGYCVRGDKCLRSHPPLQEGRTLLFQHLNPKLYDLERFFSAALQYGEIEHIKVVRNEGDPLDNIYVVFRKQSEAQLVLNSLKNGYFGSWQYVRWWFLSVRNGASPVSELPTELINFIALVTNQVVQSDFIGFNPSYGPDYESLLKFCCTFYRVDKCRREVCPFLHLDTLPLKCWKDKTQLSVPAREDPTSVALPDSPPFI